MSRKKKNFLAVVAIAKNEGRYFKEWIDYHRMVGVEKFYIYDNESDDNTKQVLGPYIKKGIVDYVFFPGEKMQRPAYNDALRRTKDLTEWLAIIDLDEFIVPMARSKITCFLKRLPKNVNQFLIKWRVYGSSGHIKSPAGFVMENYKWRHENDHDIEFKCIVRPKYVQLNKSAHYCEVDGDTVDENTNKISKLDWHMDIPNNKIRVNHYQCKSWEDAEYKRNRTDVLHGKIHNKYTKEEFDKMDRNEVRDNIMDKYVRRLKIKAVFDRIFS